MGSLVKTIKQQLIEKGYREDIVDLVNSVACHIYDGTSDLGLLCQDIIKDFTNPVEVVTQQGRIIQSVSVLVEEEYIRLHQGRYILTEKGKNAFNQ